MGRPAQATASQRPGRFRRLTGGPGRRLAIGASLGLIAFVGVTIWRIRSLDGLPDIGDPFDVAVVRRPVDIPDADNAIVAYAAAHPKLVNPSNPIDEDRSCSIHNAVSDGRIQPLTWSSAPPDLRDYLKAKRAALEIWREGSERRDAVYHQPERMAADLPLSLITDAAVLAGMAALEGSRLEEAGAPGEAWAWYRAMLRASRLVGRHGDLAQRFFGARIHALAARCILRWASDPRVNAGRLRRALDDTLAADALTPPVSDAIKLSYLMTLSVVEDLDLFDRSMLDFGRPALLLGDRLEGLREQPVSWGGMRYPVQRLRLHATNDVERSRRALRLLFANWLAQADRPEGRRAPLAIRTPTWIYADDPSAPAAARAVSPDDLARVIDRTEIARFWFDLGPPQHEPPWEGQGELARERRRRSVLIVRLAAEVYRREHGMAPATAGALVGPVLKDLPEGIAATDPIPAGLE